MRVWLMVHDLPRITPRMAYGVCALNVAIPGSGTMVAAMQSNNPEVRQTQLYVALLQLLTATQLVGSAWSIYWGILMIQKAREDQERQQRANAGRSITPSGSAVRRVKLDDDTMLLEQKSLLQKMAYTPSAQALTAADSQQVFSAQAFNSSGAGSRR